MTNFHISNSTVNIYQLGGMGETTLGGSSSGGDALVVIAPGLSSVDALPSFSPTAGMTGASFADVAYHVRPGDGPEKVANELVKQLDRFPELKSALLAKLPPQFRNDRMLAKLLTAVIELAICTVPGDDRTMPGGDGNTVISLEQLVSAMSNMTPETLALAMNMAETNNLYAGSMSD